MTWASKRLRSTRTSVARTFGLATIRIRLRDDVHGRLTWSCSACQDACEHGGAALSVILEEKLALGLARPPRERVPAESLGEEELLQRALADREERARTERMTLRSSEPKRLWSDYTISSAASGKTYRLALRGSRAGQSYCSCPDFRKNTLGTCKHIIYALVKLRRRFGKASFSRAYRPKRVAVYLAYGADLELRVACPAKLDPRAARILRPIMNQPIVDLPDLLERVRKLERIGENVAIHPDAEEFIEQRLMLERLRRKCAEIRSDPAGHELRHELLRARTTALSTRRYRLRCRGRTLRPGGRYGTRKDHPGHRNRGVAGSRGRSRARTRDLPGLRQVAVGGGD